MLYLFLIPLILVVFNFRFKALKKALNNSKNLKSEVLFSLMSVILCLTLIFFIQY